MQCSYNILLQVYRRYRLKHALNERVHFKDTWQRCDIQTG